MRNKCVRVDGACGVYDDEDDANSDDDCAGDDDDDDEGTADEDGIVDADDGADDCYSSSSSSSSSSSDSACRRSRRADCVHLSATAYGTMSKWASSCTLHKLLDFHTWLLRAWFHDWPQAQPGVFQACQLANAQVLDGAA